MAGNSSQSPQAKRGGGQDHSQFTKGAVPRSFSAKDKAREHERALDLIGESEKDREGGFPPGTSPRR
jgi:hypothetical protein